MDTPLFMHIYTDVFYGFSKCIYTEGVQFMVELIDSFRGKYHFLSNFYSCPIVVEGVPYLNAEATFQAFKLSNVSERHIFSNLTPSEAKRTGRRVLLRPDWESVKENLMYEVIKAKFSSRDALKIALLETGSARLVEGNDWGDHYWGVVNGVGKNRLGELLMRLRTELSV